MRSNAEELRPELASEVKRLLAKFSLSDKPLTSREAAELTGLSPSTVAKMMRGIPVGRFVTKKLAERLGGEIELLLSLSGYKVERSVDLLDAASKGNELEYPTIKPLMPLGDLTSMMQFDREALGLRVGRIAYVESWSRGLRIEGMVLEPNYHHGDVLLIQERFERLDGKQFLVLHNQKYETGFFLKVGKRNYRLNEDGTQLTALVGDFEFLGKIVGCLRYNYHGAAE